MAINQLDTENADRDITSSITVLTDTPDAASNMLCQGYVVLGDGAKDIDGSGGDFEFVVTVGGQTIQPSPQIINFGTEIRSAAWTTVFPVPANEEVILKIKSPNAADSDVDTTAYLYDVFPAPTAAEVVNEWETQSQADPTGFHVNVKEVNGTAQTANDNGSDINTLITQVGTAGDGLTNINLPNQTMDIIGNITGNLSGSVGSVTGGATEAKQDTAQTELDKIGTIPALDGGGQTIGAAIAKLADDNGGADFDAGTDSLQELRDHIGDGTNLTEAGGDGDHLNEAGGDGDHLTAINLPNQTMDIVGDITGNLSGSVGSVTGHTNQTGDSFALANGATGFVAIDTVVDAILAMLDDARTEPGDIAPPVNPDAMTKLDYLYKFLRNKIETTSTRIHVYDDAGANKDHSSVISDDAVTFTRGEFGAGD